jgi:hypothetical protein
MDTITTLHVFKTKELTGFKFGSFKFDATTVRAKRNSVSFLFNDLDGDSVAGVNINIRNEEAVLAFLGYIKGGYGDSRVVKLQAATG